MNSKTKIALLRGINVGSHQRIRMKELKETCLRIGWGDVRTYLQSGNVLFTASEDAHILEKTLEQAVVAQYGFEVPVVVRSVEEVSQLYQNEVFLDQYPIEQLYLSFLKSSPTQEKRQLLREQNFLPEEYVIREKELLLWCEGPYHKIKLSNGYLEKLLGVTATTRSCKTIKKLLEILA